MDRREYNEPQKDMTKQKQGVIDINLIAIDGILADILDTTAKLHRRLDSVTLPSVPTNCDCDDSAKKVRPIASPLANHMSEQIDKLIFILERLRYLEGNLDI